MKLFKNITHSQIKARTAVIPSCLTEPCVSRYTAVSAILEHNFTVPNFHGSPKLKNLGRTVRKQSPSKMNGNFTNLYFPFSTRRKTAELGESRDCLGEGSISREHGSNCSEEFRSGRDCSRIASIWVS